MSSIECCRHIRSFNRPSLRLSIPMSLTRPANSASLGPVRNIAYISNVLHVLGVRKCCQHRMRLCFFSLASGHQIQEQSMATRANKQYCPCSSPFSYSFCSLLLYLILRQGSRALYSVCTSCSCWAPYKTISRHFAMPSRFSTPPFCWSLAFSHMAEQC